MNIETPEKKSIKKKKKENYSLMSTQFEYPDCIYPEGHGAH